MHAFSAIPSNLETAEAMLYTGAHGKKVIVIGSSMLSAGGQAANVGVKLSQWEPTDSM